MEKTEYFPILLSDNSKGGENEEQNERDNTDEKSGRSIEVGIRISEETVFEIGDWIVGMMFYNLSCGTEKNMKNCLWVREEL